MSARSLAESGATVVAADLEAQSDALEAGVLAIRDGGSCAEARVFDITSDAEVEEAVAGVVGSHGQLDIVAHHAGVMLRKPSLETGVDDWRLVIDANLTGTWLVARAAAKAMIQQGSGGSIITTSSIYANIVGPIPESAYYASKAGVANLTRGLAAEWGSDGIRVNAVAPGVFYPTRMTQALGDDPSMIERMTRRTLLGRLGDPETDFPGVVLWLASDAARYVTGQTIYVDGGWTAW